MPNVITIKILTFFDENHKIFFSQLLWKQYRIAKKKPYRLVIGPNPAIPVASATFLEKT